jgi:uncharacterized protein
MSDGRWLGLAPGAVRVDGPMRRRADATWTRLAHPAFRAPDVFENVDAVDWPGDWVARTLHAHVILGRALGHPSEEARAIVATMPEHLNSEGYFGELIDPAALTEQQIGSPPGWLIRGLLEYQRWTGDDSVAPIIESLRSQIAIPLADWWASYPISMDAREANVGDVVGLSTWRSGNWILSSDIGNQFMILDGLTALYEYAPSPELEASIRAGIDRFLEVDLEEANVQTHATLTTLRGILRFYRIVRERSLLEAVTERYSLYRSRGMTAAYANINWFNRPDTWTEPCAIVDSFVLAVDLWRETDDWGYLRDAHLIWHNAIGRGQRGNGGFGCDTCVGFDSPIVRMKNFYEAFFCCTQRSAEGHVTAQSALYHVRDNTIAVTMYEDSTATLALPVGSIRLRQRTSYPADFRTSINVEASDVGHDIQIRFFTGEWAEPVISVNGERIEASPVDGFVEITTQLHVGDRIDLWGALTSWSSGLPPWSKLDGYRVHHLGPAILVHPGDREVSLPASISVSQLQSGDFEVVGTDIKLQFIDDAIDYVPSHEVMRDRDADYVGWSESLIAEVDGIPRQVAFAQTEVEH